MGSRSNRPLATASEKLTGHVFRNAKVAGEQRLCDVEAVEGPDVLLAGGRDRLLRLNHFDVAGHAGGEPVARLRELLSCQVARSGGDLQLLRARAQIEKGRADVVVETRLEIGEARLPRAQI